MEMAIRTSRRRSFVRWILIIAGAVLALPILEIIVGQIIISCTMGRWLSADIPLPDGSGHVKYMVQLSNRIVAEYDRQVRIETKDFPSTTVIVSSDPCGAEPVDVYWYPADGQEGPYLQFIDPIYAEEYVLDLRHGGVRNIEWHRDRFYIGKCTTDLSSPKASIDFYGLESCDGDSYVPKASGILSKSKGQYIGTIRYSALGCRYGKSKPSISHH